MESVSLGLVDLPLGGAILMSVVPRGCERVVEFICEFSLLIIRISLVGVSLLIPRVNLLSRK
jgi:hypothetical protein